ncbi:class IV lanthionine synthetase LanL [Kitasatospora sp. NPDC059722]|uniref:class IV lanthionine synthetase LanL n=1 Tax=Kitasatospora sp. NPDC059722 TaxID=3346925 RepID=UPI0036C20A85
MREHPAGHLAQLARLVARAPEGGGRRRLHADGQWLYLHDRAMPALAHGWKLHVSARAAQLPLLLDLVVPVLLRRTCDAKFAAGADVLGATNSGAHGAAAVGKAVTVYPREGEVVALGEELAQLLAGWDGPRVVSDRQVRAGSPVYYRYGPFRAPQDQDVALMNGPDGRTFPGLAQPSYAQPPWAVDPFTAAAATTAVTAAAPPKDTRVGEGRYRITAGISRAPGGHVYRGVELASGLGVVVKQARAFVGEDTEGVDARGRLRHERRVLAALAGVAGVPRLVDYFRHGVDEYLVTSACGPRDLRRDVLAHGPYAEGDSGGRGWREAARALLRVLDAVHARGVVVCDLKPANVVRGEAGSWSLVDFGVSALDGERPAGATPGYGLPVASVPARPADDYYALGTTLHFALTGLDPVAIGPDPAASRDRTLACLAAALPAPDHPALAVVAGLLSFDAGERTAAAAALREGRGPAGRKVTRPAADGLGEVVAHTVGTCVRMARALLGSPSAASRPRTLLSLYDGAAGLGLELLQHADEHPGAREAAAALARWTAAHPALGLLGPGLYDGRAGVELFLAHAAARLGTPEPVSADADARLGTPEPVLAHADPRLGTPEPALADVPDPGALVSTDQISGAAGVGTAHLLLADLVRASDGARAQRHLAVAAACARRLTDGPPQDLKEEPNPGTAALAEGFAHGRAGLAHLLLALPSPDAATQAAGRAIVEDLAAALPRLAAEAARPGATRRWGSWCRGLAGIGTVLLQAGLCLGEDAYVDLAAEAAGACRALAPRMGQVVQCCGLAGVGELFVDLASATGEERHREAAGQIAALVLSRAGGPPHRPVFPGTALLTESPAWATGTPGVLTFLRRLHRGTGPRPALLPLA